MGGNDQERGKSRPSPQTAMKSMRASHNTRSTNELEEGALQRKNDLLSKVTGRLGRHHKSAEHIGELPDRQKRKIQKHAKKNQPRLVAIIQQGGETKAVAIKGGGDSPSKRPAGNGRGTRSNHMSWPNSEGAPMEASFSWTRTNSSKSIKSAEAIDLSDDHHRSVAADSMKRNHQHETSQDSTQKRSTPGKSRQRQSSSNVSAPRRTASLPVFSPSPNMQRTEVKAKAPVLTRAPPPIQQVRAPSLTSLGVESSFSSVGPSIASFQPPIHPPAQFVPGQEPVWSSVPLPNSPSETDDERLAGTDKISQSKVKVGISSMPKDDLPLKREFAGDRLSNKSGSPVGDRQGLSPRRGVSISPEISRKTSVAQRPKSESPVHTKDLLAETPMKSSPVPRKPGVRWDDSVQSPKRPPEVAPVVAGTHTTVKSKSIVKKRNSRRSERGPVISSMPQPGSRGRTSKTGSRDESKSEQGNASANILHGSGTTKGSAQTGENRGIKAQKSFSSVESSDSASTLQNSVVPEVDQSLSRNPRSRSLQLSLHSLPGDGTGDVEAIPTILQQMKHVGTQEPSSRSEELEELRTTSLPPTRAKSIDEHFLRNSYNDFDVSNHSEDASLNVSGTNSTDQKHIAQGTPSRSKRVEPFQLDESMHSLDSIEEPGAIDTSLPLTPIIEESVRSESRHAATMSSPRPLEGKQSIVRESNQVDLLRTPPENQPVNSDTPESNRESIDRTVLDLKKQLAASQAQVEALHLENSQLKRRAQLELARSQMALLEAREQAENEADQRIVQLMKERDSAIEESQRLLEIIMKSCERCRENASDLVGRTFSGR